MSFSSDVIEQRMHWKRVPKGPVSKRSLLCDISEPVNKKGGQFASVIWKYSR